MDEALATYVEQIDWFSAVGKQPLPAWSMPAVAVASQNQALKYCSARGWEDVTLEAANELTGFLTRRYDERYSQWNDIVIAAKSRIVTPLADRVWQPFAAQRGLGKGFVDCVSWDVLSAIMEHEYRDCTERPIFFLHLLEVYCAGHFPCGWAGKWPAGQLRVW